MEYTSGRGAQNNPHNRFLAQEVIPDFDFMQHLQDAGEEFPRARTKFLKVHPKTIVNKVTSEDLPFEYSMNPYQGCEHGCIYCYARNSHEYWGYSAGEDFEANILVKSNAADLLERKFASKNYVVKPIMLSGNTDCYQPVERRLGITRRLLQVCLKHKHPVGIITKNAMVLRDLDILTELAKDNLVRVVLSITTLNDKLRSRLEPRTSIAGLRFNAVRKLSENNVPTFVMMAPIIPSLNSPEIMKIAEKSAENGASGFYHTVVRLNGALPQIFEDWLDKNYPDRKNKILNQIKEIHGGQLNDSRSGVRMHGEGEHADHITKMVKLAKKKYKLDTSVEALRCDLFIRPGGHQMSLF
ncbi:MAG: PA0069 family radical SAM protein [Reichenbachiella sp.]